MRRAINKLLVLLPLVLVLSVSAFAQPNLNERESLRGVRGISVLVDEIKPELQRRGLTRQRIQTDVETSLRKAGIHVFDPYDVVLTTPRPTVRPNVYISISSHSRSRYPGLYAISVEVEFLQEAVLARPFKGQSGPGNTPGVTTWRSGFVALMDESDFPELLQHINDDVNKFINDYLAVNPKPLP